MERKTLCQRDQCWEFRDVTGDNDVTAAEFMGECIQFAQKLHHKSDFDYEECPFNFTEAKAIIYLAEKDGEI